MIEITCNSAKMGVKRGSTTHPDWRAWMEASEYGTERARKELGVASGTFYRRIKRAPSLQDRLSMAALYEGLEPFTTKRIEG